MAAVPLALIALTASSCALIPPGGAAPAPTAGSSTPSTSAPAAGWPDATNTGVPDGVVLGQYTGPCTIDEPNTVIDSKLVECERLRIIAENVSISNSRINGRIDTPSPNDEKFSFSFSLVDSEVHLGDVLQTAIKQGNFRAQRIEVTGGVRSIHCEDNCLIEDSWIHGQARDPSGKAHFGGIRMSQNLVLRHNTLTCEADRQPGKSACSAVLTGYGDFAPVQNNLIERNIFYGGSSSRCAYGGSTRGKPFAEGARDIRFIDNVFVRGETGKCGIYGPISAFDATKPGNVWKGNVWDDGTPVPTPTYRTTKSEPAEPEEPQEDEGEG